MIQLPSYLWFFQKYGNGYFINVFSGSLGTDPKKGCTNHTTFHYKAFVQVGKEGDPVSFYAEYYRRFPWNEGEVTSEKVWMNFEPSQAGIMEAEQWLVEQYLKGEEE